MSETAFQKTTCPHCGVNVEYPNEAEGQIAPCPKCGNNLLLQKSVEDIERQRRRLQAEYAQEIFQKRQRRNKILTTCAGLGVVLIIGILVLAKSSHLNTKEKAPAVGRLATNSNAIQITAEELKTKAEQGDAEAQCNLGLRYENGQEGPTNMVEAVKWFRKAADQNYAAAESCLASCYDEGQVVGQDHSEDYSQALKWYRKAAEQNYAEAQVNLGVHYANGHGVKADDKEAVKWYRKAVEQNYAKAEYKLAGCYKFGYGVEEDRVEAMKLYHTAAEQNSIDAQIELGYEARFANDLVEAAKWYRKAADNGDSDAAVALKHLNDPPPDPSSINFPLSAPLSAPPPPIPIETLKLKAEQGDTDAQGQLVNIYESGLQDEKQNFVEAVKWCQKLAASEYTEQPHYQYMLGLCYQYGVGVKTDTVAAVSWYIKAVTNGFDPYAEYALATCYQNGNGVAVDFGEAAKWFRLAAEQKNGFAMTELGNLYFEGKGVPKSYSYALEWYSKAKDSRTGKALMARYQIGKIYEFGLGVPINLSEAMTNYFVAATMLEIWRQSMHTIDVGSPPTDYMPTAFDLSYESIDQQDLEATKLAKIAVEKLKVKMNKPAVETINVSAKVTEANTTWWKWAWKLTLNNNTAASVEVNTAVQFFDKDGYLVDEDTYGVHRAVLGANSSQSFTGFSLINLPGAKNVARVGAKVEIQ